MVPLGEVNTNIFANEFNCTGDENKLINCLEPLTPLLVEGVCTRFGLQCRGMFTFCVLM